MFCNVSNSDMFAYVLLDKADGVLDHAVCGNGHLRIADFFSKNKGPFFYFTSKGPRRHVDVAYPDGAYLVFGREDAGLPEELLVRHEADCVRMPMRRGERCLNLSNAVAVGVYEVLRQWDFAGLETHGQLTRYEWSEDVQ